MSPDSPPRRAAAALAACLLALPLIALGDDEEGLSAVEASLAERPGRALWELGAGIGGAVTPAYPGSSETTTRVLPLPIVAYRGRFLRAGDGSVVSGRLFRNERLEFDVSLTGSFDADSDDVDVRAGMPDLGFLFEVGPELE
ncbi:MAG: MipA/OmpV family protein, partial [Pseudomonadota bacterium]